MEKMGYLCVRVNSRLKEEFCDLCKKEGVTIASAVSLFAEKVVESGELPFSLSRDRRYPDEEKVRMSVYIGKDLRLRFATVCEERFHLPMSTVIRCFMDYCVDDGSDWRGFKGK